MSYKYPVGVLGAGAWGTALAEHLAGACGHNVLLWSYDKKAAADIKKKRKNSIFLPGYPLSEKIDVTTSPEDVAKNCKVILYASPVPHCAEMAAMLAPILKEDQTVVISSKGFRESDGAILTDVWQDMMPHFHNLAVLSGPTFAHEVAGHKPALATLAASRKEVLKEVDKLFNSSLMRLYFTHDLIGVQVGAAMKNVIAIGAGISDGLGMGENFKAGVLCRGIVEMMRYSHSLGGERLTLSGLSGVGDLMLSSHEGSRNYRFGRYLGEGMTAKEAFEKVGSTVEGANTAAILTVQGASKGIDMGVVMAVNGVIHGDIDASRTFRLLLERPRVVEFDIDEDLI